MWRPLGFLLRKRNYLANIDQKERSLRVSTDFEEGWFWFRTKTHPRINQLCKKSPDSITERVNRIRVTNSSESETALFPAKKVQNPPPIFPIKKVTLHACNFYCIFMWQLIPYPLKTAKNYLILILFQDSSKTDHPK